MQWRISSLETPIRFQAQVSRIKPIEVLVAADYGMLAEEV